jgi:hypothetical protein
MVLCWRQLGRWSIRQLYIYQAAAQEDWERPPSLQRLARAFQSQGGHTIDPGRMHIYAAYEYV